ALVGADLDLAADVGGDLAAKIALGLVVRLDPVTQGDQLVVGDFVNAQVATDAGVGQGLGSAGTADAVDVGESDLEALVARQVDTDQTCHGRVLSLSVVES